ncbi:MAG TPA: Pycsar system effector family protein [Arenimonas sp.]|nr:Pycsar system effector family protein [Arenimonas sp.]
MSSNPADREDPAKAFFDVVPERNTGDAIMRTTQQHHVQLSLMADNKANIVITMSSIVLTLVLGRLGDPDLRLASITLAGFTMCSLFLAVLAILPKYRPLRLQGETLPPQFNILFFGHFAELSRERFQEEVAKAMRTDGSVYFTMSKDIYSLGWYLAHHKYRYLRWSYLFFLGGFLLASLVQLAQILRLYVLA